jgi:hypothetical protein
MALHGSPVIMRAKAKVTINMPTRTGIAINKRRRIYWNIFSTPSFQIKMKSNAG